MTPTHTKRPRFFLLAPDIFGSTGGIQIYTGFLFKALQELYPHASYEVFLKYDHHSDIPNSQSKTQFHCFGQWPRWLQSVLLMLKIILLGIQRKPTLVIATHLNYAIACDWLKRLTGIPYWVVVHGWEGWNLRHPLRQAALRHANQVVAVSQYTRNRLLKEQPLAPGHVAVLPNTFLASKFQPRPKPAYLLKRYGLIADAPVIFTIGRLARYKGYEQILQALVEVRRHLPTVRYVLAGTGNLAGIRDLAVQLGVEDALTLPGFIPDEELCDHYNLCDVFAMPSQGEGFGIVYLEALACGKPVLAGNRDGAIDPLVGGKLGCLVDPEDVAVIAQSLIQILRQTYPNPVLYNAVALRQETIERFEFDQFRQTLATLVQAEMQAKQPLYSHRHSVDPHNREMKTFMRSHIQRTPGLQGDEKQAQCNLWRFLPQRDLQ